VSSPDPLRDRQLVALARAIEVLRGRRRRVLKELAELDSQIRTHRKLLDGLLQPELPSGRQIGELPGDAPESAPPREEG
jgi:hypothetical protein